MRMIILTAALVLAAPGVAGAQTAPAPAATPAAPAASSATAGHYSTSTTEIGVLLDDPAARALLDKHVPGMTTNEQVDMARSMTMKDIQQYSPDTITDKVLAALDADFAKLPAKKQP